MRGRIDLGAYEPEGVVTSTTMADRYRRQQQLNGSAGRSEMELFSTALIEFQAIDGVANGAIVEGEM